MFGTITRESPPPIIPMDRALGSKSEDPGITALTVRTDSSHIS